MRLHVDRNIALRPRTSHTHQIFFLHVGVFANELARHSTVLRHDQHAHRVNVQAAGRRQAFELRRAETNSGGVARPLIARLKQHHGGFVTIFGLAAHVAHGLVQQHRHLLFLLGLSFTFYRDAIGGAHLHAHLGHLAIDPHPPLIYPSIGLAA